jgi:hypothetical protein
MVSMKKIILSLIFIGLLAGFVSAQDRFLPENNNCIYRSSFTKTNETTAFIVDSMFLKSVIITSATAGGFLTIYDSTYTAAGQVCAPIDMSTKGVYEFDAVMQNGISYTTTGNSNGATIMWRRKGY